MPIPVQISIIIISNLATAMAHTPRQVISAPVCTKKKSYLCTTNMIDVVRPQLLISKQKWKQPEHPYRYGCTQEVSGPGLTVIEADCAVAPEMSFRESALQKGQTVSMH